MNEYITTATFIKSKEKAIDHQDIIKKSMKEFNCKSKNSTNYKVIHSISFLNDYVFEIRWASANQINVLQAGRALRLFSNTMLQHKYMREKIIGGKFLSYHTIDASKSDTTSVNLEILEKIINIMKTNPTDPRLLTIQGILKES